MKVGKVALGAALISSSATTLAFAGHHGKHHRPGGGHKGHPGHKHKGLGAGHKVPEIDAMSGMAAIALVLCAVLLFKEKFSR